MAKNKDIHGWRKAAFYNPTTGDVVQVNRIIPDQSEWSPEIIRTEDTIGSVYGGRSYMLQIGAVDVDQGKKEQLAAWMEAGLDIHAVVFNPHGTNIQWYQDEPLHFIPAAGTNARDGADVHQMDLMFEGAASVIYQRRNLIAGPALPLIFPVAGAAITYSITTATVATLTLEFRDFAGDIITQKQVATVAGRNSVTEISPAGTYQITVSEPGDASDQALRTDGSDEYTTT